MRNEVPNYVWLGARVGRRLRGGEDRKTGGVCGSGWEVVSGPEAEQELHRIRVGSRPLLGTAVLCLIKSARVNRSDLISDGAKSRVPEVQRSQCSPRLRDAAVLPSTTVG